VHDAPSDELRETYERRAELQYAEPVALPDPAVDLKFKRVLELITSTFPADSMLDCGCGDGRFLAAIARRPDRPDRLVGTDLSKRILATAKLTVAHEAAEVQVEFVRANAEALPFAAESFERVLSVQVIEHLLDPRLGVAEMARVLRPGGALVISTDNTDNRISRVLNLPRSTVIRMLGVRGRHAKVEFPHVTFKRAALNDLLLTADLEVLRMETFRVHLDGLDIPGVKRTLNSIERVFPRHSWGDIIVAIARKRG
jgi:SAM-dependent methyltransferase